MFGFEGTNISALHVSFLIFQDVNECNIRRGGCDSFCFDIAGSYVCGCEDEGFELSDKDKHSCIGKYSLSLQSLGLPAHLER